MAPSYLSFNSRGLRSYLYRVPLATRLFTILIFALCIAGYFAPWLPEAGALYPSKVSLIAGEIDKNAMDTSSMLRRNCTI